MEKPKKIYWKGVEQLKNDPSFVKNNEKEFPSDLPIKDVYGDNAGDEALNTNRRDFLKTMGFGVAAVSLAACEAPVRNAIPYINKPEDVDPGIPNYYASTYLDGSDYCSVVVKTREGRPIFIQGNSFSSVSQGGTNARVNSSILSLYDEERQQAPSKGGTASDWTTVDGEIKSKLAEISAAGGKIRIVSNTIPSPSTKRVIDEFAAKLGNTQHVVYDAVSCYGMTEANKNMFGKAVIPSYSFDKANVVVNINADFLGGWVSPIEYSAQFGKTRKVGKDKKNMSKVYTFETMMSITGASSDYRQPIKPSQEGLVVGRLYDLVAGKVGGSAEGFAALGIPAIDKTLEKAAKDLASQKGKSIVVSGSNDTSVQMLVNGINEMLSSYGATIDLDTPNYLKQGNDTAMKSFVEELKGGSIDAVIFYNANPVYDHPLFFGKEGDKAKQALSKVELTISTADKLHETASLTGYNCPDSHFLESWNDAEPKKGSYSLGQPTISTIFKTRQVQDSLIQWADLGGDYLTRIKNFWETELSVKSNEASFQKFWFRSLHNGVFDSDAASAPTAAAVVADHGGDVHAEAAHDDHATDMEASEDAVAAPSTSSLGDAVSAVKSAYKAKSDGIELVTYASSVMGTGVHSNNPILQETPDPITRVCWGSYLAVSQKMAEEQGFEAFETQTTEAKVSVNGQEFTLPVVSQPGLAYGVVAVPFGYGRSEGVGKVAAGEAQSLYNATVNAGANGVNAFSMTSAKGNVSYTANAVTLENLGTKQDIAQTQTHHTIMGRESIIQETTLSEYKKDPKAGRFTPHIATYTDKTSPGNISVWDIAKDGYQEDGKKAKENKEKSTLWFDRIGTTADKHVYPNHHWGMAIDLNTCTGCAACVTACHLENNVPVVGKQEVINRREMHWLRIDRYYSNDPAFDYDKPTIDSEEGGSEGSGSVNYSELEIAAENPEVVFQPMMCQHCNNAPCETVCPVVATTHSSEGLNQMTYNRCVGTKYCANNCPYKVRRFNWFRYHNSDMFDYYMNDKLGKMVLNPDVTVRSRGVMEKCSLCVQRIQSGKLKAKIEQRKVSDADVNTACASACPTNAITFGDLNNMDSSVRQLMETEVDERAYNVLEEINVSPNVWYLTKVRNKDSQEA